MVTGGDDLPVGASWRPSE